MGVWEIIGLILGADELFLYNADKDIQSGLDFNVLIFDDGNFGGSVSDFSLFFIEHGQGLFISGLEQLDYLVVIGWQ